MSFTSALAISSVGIGGYVIAEALGELRERRHGKAAVFAAVGLILIAFGAFLLITLAADWLG